MGNTREGTILLDQQKLSVVAKVMLSTDPQLQAQAMRLLAFLCLLPPKGSSLVHDVIKAFGQDVKEAAPFEFFVSILKKQDVVIELVVQCLSLINSLVNSPDDLEDRLKHRGHFLSQGILEIFKTFKESSASEEALLLQISVFEEEMDADDAEMRIFVVPFPSLPPNNPLQLFLSWQED